MLDRAVAIVARGSIACELQEEVEERLRRALAIEERQDLVAVDVRLERVGFDEAQLEKRRRARRYLLALVLLKGEGSIPPPAAAESLRSIRTRARGASPAELETVLVLLQPTRPATLELDAAQAARLASGILRAEPPRREVLQLVYERGADGKARLVDAAFNNQSVRRAVDLIAAASAPSPAGPTVAPSMAPAASRLDVLAIGRAGDALLGASISSARQTSCSATPATPLVRELEVRVGVEYAIVHEVGLCNAGQSEEEVLRRIRTALASRPEGFDAILLPIALKRPAPEDASADIACAERVRIDAEEAELDAAELLERRGLGPDGMERAVVLGMCTGLNERLLNAGLQADAVQPRLQRLLDAAGWRAVLLDPARPADPDEAQLGRLLARVREASAAGCPRFGLDQFDALQAARERRAPEACWPGGELVLFGAVRSARQQPAALVGARTPAGGPLRANDVLFLELEIEVSEQKWDPGGSAVVRLAEGTQSFFAPASAPLLPAAPGRCSARLTLHPILASGCVAEALERLPPSLAFELDASGRRFSPGSLSLPLERFTGDLAVDPPSPAPQALRVLFSGPPGFEPEALLDSIATSLSGEGGSGIVRRLPHGPGREHPLRDLTPAPPWPLCLVESAGGPLERDAAGAHAVCLCVNIETVDADAARDEIGTLLGVVLPAYRLLTQRLRLPLLIALTDTAADLPPPDERLEARRRVARALSVPLRKVVYVPCYKAGRAERSFERDQAVLAALLRLASLAAGSWRRSPQCAILERLRLHSFDSLRFVFLIDHDNSKAASFSVLDGPPLLDYGRALLFFWQDKAHAERVEALSDPARSGRPDVVPIRAASGRRNSADFAFAVCAGELHAALPPHVKLFLVSADENVLDVATLLAPWGPRDVRRVVGTYADLLPMALEELRAAGGTALRDVRAAGVRVLAKRAAERLAAERPRRATAALQMIGSTLMRPAERELYGGPEALDAPLRALFDIDIALEPGAAIDAVAFLRPPPAVPQWLADRAAACPLLGHLAALISPLPPPPRQSSSILKTVPPPPSPVSASSPLWPILTRIFGCLTRDELRPVARVNDIFASLAHLVRLAAGWEDPPAPLQPGRFDTSTHAPISGHIARVECRVFKFELGVTMHVEAGGCVRRAAFGSRLPTAAVQRYILHPEERLLQITAIWAPMGATTILAGLRFRFAGPEGERRWDVDTGNTTSGAQCSESELITEDGAEIVGLRGATTVLEGGTFITELEAVTRRPADVQRMLRELAPLILPRRADAAVERSRASEASVQESRGGRRAEEVLVLPGESIVDAVKKAAPGQTIRLVPGRYVEAAPVVLDKEVHIVGPREAVLDTHGWVSSTYTDKELPCGLYCTGHASPSVKGITIGNCIGHGILINCGSRATIENCDVSGIGTGGSHGIIVAGHAAAAALRGNRVHGFEYGAWFNANSTGVIENNEMFDFVGTHAGGIYVWNGADVVIRGNRMRNMRLGVDVASGGKGSFEGNTLERMDRPVSITPDCTGFRVGTNVIADERTLGSSASATKEGAAAAEREAGEQSRRADAAEEHSRKGEASVREVQRCWLQLPPAGADSALVAVAASCFPDKLQSFDDSISSDIAMRLAWLEMP